MEIKIIKRASKKFILRVKESGEITCTVPLKSSKKSINDFIKSREDWLRETIIKMEELKKERILTNDPDKIYLLGNKVGYMEVFSDFVTIFNEFNRNSSLFLEKYCSYPFISKSQCEKELMKFFLTWGNPVERISNRIRDRNEKEINKIALEENFDLHQFKLQYLTIKALIIIPKLVNEQLLITEIKINHLSLKWMKSRWGSCNYTKGYINLNNALICSKIECINHIIFHELAHIKIPSHNRDFYKLVSSYFPNYKELERELIKI